MDTSSILDFLSDLAQNNHKGWLDANRKIYEQAKKIFEEQMDALLLALQGFDEGLLGLEVKKCIFRINRDVRFSKDKSPYKQNFGAYFQRGGKKAIGAGYYWHLQPNGESFCAGGVYTPQPPELAKIRQEIDYNEAEFRTILQNPDFVRYFGELENTKIKTLPKGYTADNPAIDLLKYKSFTVWHRLSDEAVRSDAWFTEAVAAFQAMQPLTDFLNRALDNVAETTLPTA